MSVHIGVAMPAVSSTLTMPAWETVSYALWMSTKRAYVLLPGTAMRLRSACRRTKMSCSVARR